MIPIIFVAPVVQLVIFGFAVNTDVNRVPTVLVDQDRTPASRALIDRFTKSGYFELVGVEDAAKDVDPWLVSGHAQVAVVVGSGYGEALASGGSPEVQIIADGSDSSPATVALGYGSGIVSAANREALAERVREYAAKAAEEGRTIAALGRVDL